MFYNCSVFHNEVSGIGQWQIVNRNWTDHFSPFFFLEHCGLKTNQ